MDIPKLSKTCNAKNRMHELRSSVSVRDEDGSTPRLLRNINRFFINFLLFAFIILIFSDLSTAISSSDDENSLSSSTRKKLTSKKSKNVANASSDTEINSDDKINFDIKLCRYINKDERGIYFSKVAKLKCSNVIISSPKNLCIFGQNSPLKRMDDFLDKQVKLDKKVEINSQNGWKRNHLTTNLFVIVDDKIEDVRRCIEGSILAEEITLGKNTVYDFSVIPENKNLNGRKIADFVSSKVSEEKLSKFIDKNGYIPMYKSKSRPIFDINNHGDRLAIDTVSSNIDMFFSLIRKSAHREDLPILGMGLRYYSSYDACNDCFEKIYNAKNTIKEKIIRFANDGGYKICNEDNNIPFYSLFYSIRPYKKASYAIEWHNPEDDMYYYKSSLNYKMHRNRYCFQFNSKNKSNKKIFSNKPHGSLHLLSEQTEMGEEKIYSYIYNFDKKNGNPVKYQYEQD